MGPGVGSDDFGGVRRALERVVHAVVLAALDLDDLGVDGDHRLDEAVDLGLRFRLGRLDHQGARHREAHGRGVEAEVHQALGHVFVADAGLVLQWTQVDDALVRDQAVVAGVQHRVVRGQAARDVVGVEDRHFGGRSEACGAHHRDVHPRDRQDRGRAEGGGADGADAVFVPHIAGRQLVRQEFRQVGADADRADAGAAAAVRDAEGLVQVQVADVAAEGARRGQADQRVHVGAVDVDLAAVRVHDLAQFLDAFLEHAVGRRVGDHHAGQVLAVLLGLGLQVAEIDVAVVVAGGDHDLHADHAGRGRVGAVGRGRDQAHVAVAFAARFMVLLDHQEARVLALRAGVRLQRDGGVAGGGAQHGFQLGDHLAVADGLLVRRQRVDVRELGPGDRHHLGGGVELHGARAERDHGAVQRQVLVGQRAQVAQHLVLGVVAVEGRVGQVGAGADEGGREGVGDAGVQLVQVNRLAIAEHREQVGQVVAGDRFVERDADAGGVDLAQVQAARGGLLVDRAGVLHAHGQGVEEGLVGQLEAQLLQAGGQDGGLAVHSARDAGQALRAVVDRVHAGHHGQQHLRGADVRGRLFAADVLLAGLQRQAVGRIALGVDGDADQAARHAALELVAGGEVAGVRAAETERHAEALAVADHDVGAPFARRGQDRERQQVGGHDHHRACGMQVLTSSAVVAHFAVDARVLQQHAEAGFLKFFDVGRRDGAHFDADRFGAGLDDLAGLRQHVVGHVEHLRGRLADALDQGHGFGGGGAFVQHRRVGDAHAGQVGDRLLEVQDGFQAALRDFGLVRGVGGVPGRVFEDVAQDDLRRVGAVVALADQRLQHLVLRRQALEQRQRFFFGARFGELAQVQLVLAADVGRDHGVDQGGAGGVAEGRQHGCLFGFGRADVARDERIACFKLGEAGAGHDKKRVRKGLAPMLAGSRRGCAGRCARGRAHLGPSVVGGLAVGVGVEQLVVGASVARGQLEQPGAVGILVDRVGRVGDRLVDGGDGARDRRVDVAGGLDRFDHGGVVARGECLADLRQFDEHDVAQRVLRVFGDAHGQAAVFFAAHPFMGFGVFQVGRDVHGNS